MDEYEEHNGYDEIPIPTGDGWHKPDDETAAAPPQNGSWTCSCGTVNTGNFCSYCGRPAPQTGRQQNPYLQDPYQQQQYQQQPYQQDPYRQNPYQQAPYQQVPPKENNPLALASMITGLLALITCCCSPLIQFPLAVVSIVLMILSKRGKPFSGYAIAGLIMSIFAILLSILMTIMIGLVRSPQYQDFLNSPEFQDIFDEYESLYESVYGGEGEDLDSIYESIYDDYR